MMKKSSLGTILNKEEYLKLFMGSPHLGVSQNSGEDDFSSNAKEDLSRIKAAYEQATKTREFEIKLYWERAKYFWALQTKTSYLPSDAEVSNLKMLPAFDAVTSPQHTEPLLLRYKPFLLSYKPGRAL